MKYLIDLDWSSLGLAMALVLLRPATEEELDSHLRPQRCSAPFFCFIAFLKSRLFAERQTCILS
jgi:hypothetical protein